MELGIEINSNSPKGIDVKYPEGTSPRELSAKIINASLTPVIELEKAGILKDISVVLHGGIITKTDKKPKDYDVMVIYDSFQNPENINGLSDSAKDLLERIIPDGELNESYGMGIDIHDTTQGENKISAEYVDLFLVSKKTFIESLHQSPENTLDQAFTVLALLPSEIANSYPDSSDYEYYAQSYLADDTNPAVMYIFALGRVFGHKFSSSQITTMCDYLGAHIGDDQLGKIFKLNTGSISPDISDSDIQNGVNEFTPKNINYLQKILPPDLFDKTKDILSGKPIDVDVPEFANALTEAYIGHLPSFAKPYTKNRIRWLVNEGMINKRNPNMNVAKHGVLIYGKNIQDSDKNLFKEDNSFLKV